MTITDFKNKFLPLAQESANRFGFKDPYFLMAQQFAENSGDKGIIINTNNVGSLISRNDRGLKLPIGLFWKGEEYKAKSSGLWFRVYATMQDGYNDFARLLSKYYKLHECKTIEEFADKISNSAYISESNGDNRKQYEKNIVDTYYKIKKQV